MKTRNQKLAAIVVVLALFSIVAWAQRVSAYYYSAPSYSAVNTAANAMYQTAASKSDLFVDVNKKVELNHAQKVWLGALEWCESRGDETAINKKDRDGTPSYGAFQFKPGTLSFYADKYKIEKQDDYMLYGYQLAVVTAMVLDQKNITWSQQFPDCVKRLGLPPKNS